MRVERGEYETGSWEMVTRDVPDAFSPLIARTTGYHEKTSESRRFRETATAIVPVILSFGDAISLVEAPDATLVGGSFASFTAGVHTGPVVLESHGSQFCLQVDLTPLGAYRLFGGMPADDIADQMVDLSHVFGDGDELVHRLADAASWEARFEILDGALRRGFSEGPEPRAEVAWAWHQLASSRGGVAVGDLADEIGWSRRHFAAQFRRHVGVPPKTFGRIVRFDKAVDMLVPPSGRSLTFVAAACGYADQAHMTRDFKEFAGVTPTEYARNWLPGSGTAA